MRIAVWPALQSGGWRTALLNGALLGLVAYATYDLTNQATLRIWSAKVTILGGPGGPADDGGGGVPGAMGDARNDPGAPSSFTHGITTFTLTTMTMQNRLRLNGCAANITSPYT